MCAQRRSGRDLAARPVDRPRNHQRRAQTVWREEKAPEISTRKNTPIFFTQNPFAVFQRLAQFLRRTRKLWRNYAEETPTRLACRSGLLLAGGSPEPLSRFKADALSRDCRWPLSRPNAAKPQPLRLVEARGSPKATYHRWHSSVVPCRAGRVRRTANL